VREPVGLERTLRDAAIRFAIEVEAQEYDPDGEEMRQAWDRLRRAAERYRDEPKQKGRPRNVA
jgi:broad specificity phosphatase PhoE